VVTYCTYRHTVEGCVGSIKRDAHIFPCTLQWHHPVSIYKHLWYSSTTGLCQWQKFTFSGGGAKPPKFPTKLSNFRKPPPPPPFALEKAVFSPLSGQNFRKFVIFREGGGRSQHPPPTKVSTTGLCRALHQNHRFDSCQRVYSCIFRDCSWLGLKLYMIVIHIT
jgi:hypothetical protein